MLMAQRCCLESYSGEVTFSRINPLKNKSICYIQRLSVYRAVNNLHLLGAEVISLCYE